MCKCADLTAVRQVVQIEIYNVLGEKIYSSTLTSTSTSTSVDLSTKPAGIYFVKLQTEAGVQVQKIIVQ